MFPVSYGPIVIEGDCVTLTPGLYKITKPIRFKMDESTVIEGIECSALPDTDSDRVVGDNRVPDTVAA